MTNCPHQKLVHIRCQITKFNETRAGSEQSDSHSDGNSHHHAGTGQTGFEFTGKKRDKETNMFYFHDRPLLVGTPHFPQPDRAPIDPYQVMTINRYLGLNANPVKYVDPDGRALIEPLQGIDNYNDFVVKLDQLLDEKTLTGRFTFKRVADEWADLPDYIREVEYDLYAGVLDSVSGPFKHHDLEVRIPNTGIHVHTDIGKDGVRAHKDAYNPYDDPVSTAVHGAEVKYDERRNLFLNLWDEIVLSFRSINSGGVASE